MLNYQRVFEFWNRQENRCPATWHFPKTRCYLNLSDTSCLKSVGFAPASTSWIDLARHRHKKWYGELTEFRGPHFCCNFHEENEVLIHWKGGGCPIFRQNHVVSCLYEFSGGLFSCPTPKNNPKQLHWFAWMHLHPQIQTTSTNLRHCWPFQFCPWSGVSLSRDKTCRTHPNITYSIGNPSYIAIQFDNAIQPKR